jgi:uncharacterized membrane protein (UPF0127 family)
MERLVLERDGRTVASSVVRATTRRERVRGLLSRSEMRPGEALLIEQARQIHTFRMKFPIDVVFCDRYLRVLHTVRSMRPWRMTRFVVRARCVLELAADSVVDVNRGDRLALVSRTSDNYDRSR